MSSAPAPLLVTTLLVRYVGRKIGGISRENLRKI